MPTLDETRFFELESIARQLLDVIGEDPARPGLAGTPRRFAQWWTEFMAYRDDNTNTTFETVHTDQMVVVSGVRVWSLCEHHLLPFWCDLTMAYLTGPKLLGLSKFGRIAHLYAHRLQVQERLVQDIATHLQRVTESQSVAVVADGEHLCMTMRGVRTPARMRSSMLTGHFRDDPACRQEFLSLLRPVGS